MSDNEARVLLDALGHPIPPWAIWFHYERVDVSTPTEERYVPGALRADRSDWMVAGPWQFWGARNEF